MIAVGLIYPNSMGSSFKSVTQKKCNVNVTELEVISFKLKRKVGGCQKNKQKTVPLSLLISVCYSSLQNNRQRSV